MEHKQLVGGWAERLEIPVGLQVCGSSEEEPRVGAARSPRIDAASLIISLSCFTVLSFASLELAKDPIKIKKYIYFLYVMVIHYFAWPWLLLLLSLMLLRAEATGQCPFLRDAVRSAFPPVLTDIHWTIHALVHNTRHRRTC